MKSELDYLLSPRAVRERSEMIFLAAQAGKTHFTYHPEKLPEVVRFVVEVIRKNHPSLEIPFHSRWGHFRAGDVDRLKVLRARIAEFAPDERARVLLDLVVTSVLLDAGAGDAWKFHEPGSGLTIGRSEGLAIASFWMFMSGAFSDNPAMPLRATAQGLKKLSKGALDRAFQITPSNPLIGVEGRLELLHSLGDALEKGPEIFPNGRPGGIFDFLVAAPDAANRRIRATSLLRAVLDGFGSIWPGRIQLEGVDLGDCWRHPLLGSMDGTDSLIPFHKLSQWLTYSMIEPIAEAGIPVDGVHELTGLPEYRNGGLILDLGLIQLRDPAVASREHLPESELIVEWRALTIACLDRIAAGIRIELGMTEEAFPLAKVLEGGTWRAGRIAASERRAGGGSPLRLKSDGTVF